MIAAVTHRSSGIKTTIPTRSIPTSTAAGGDPRRVTSRPIDAAAGITPNSEAINTSPPRPRTTGSRTITSGTAAAGGATPRMNPARPRRARETRTPSPESHVLHPLPRRSGGRELSGHAEDASNPPCQDEHDDRIVRSCRARTWILAGSVGSLDAALDCGRVHLGLSSDRIQVAVTSARLDHEIAYVDIDRATALAIERETREASGEVAVTRPPPGHGVQ